MAIQTARVIGKTGGKVYRLWHKRAFAGRKGRGVVGSIILMSMIMEEHPEGEVVGRDG